MVEILQENRLGECWLIVDPRTSVAVTTCSDFEVEGAVNSVKWTNRYIELIIIIMFMDVNIFPVIDF